MLRNIVQGRKHHNHRLRYRETPLGLAGARPDVHGIHHPCWLSWPAVMSSLILLASIMISGCQSESQPPAADDSPKQDMTASTQQAPSSTSSDCPAVISSQAQDAYDGLAARLVAGKPVTEADFQAMCDQTDYALWLKTLQPSYINWAILRNVMTYVYAGPAIESGQERRPPKRAELADNLTYVNDHTTDVPRVLDNFITQQLQCRVLEHLQGFLEPEKLPRQLTVSFLTLLPEIRYLEEHLLVDMGLAIATRPDLLSRLMASVIYRDVAAPPGRQPHENLPGVEALVATFRKLCFEGIASWLEDFANVSFDPEHPLLGKADKGRQDIQAKVSEVLEGMYKYLAIVLKDEETLHTKGNLIDDVMRGSVGYARTGYAMADLIAKELGENRLQASSHSASAFLVAYQEAATKVYDSAQGSASQLVMKPFPSREFQELLKILREHDA